MAGLYQTGGPSAREGKKQGRAAEGRGNVRNGGVLREGEERRWDLVGVRGCDGARNMEGR